MEHLPFISTHLWNPERIGAIAIYCSDGRWGEAFDEFCHEGLHIPRYDRFAVPGGPLWLVMRFRIAWEKSTIFHNRSQFFQRPG